MRDRETPSPAPDREARAIALYNAVVQPETIWWDDLTDEMREGWLRGAALLSDAEAAPPSDDECPCCGYIGETHAKDCPRILAQLWERASEAAPPSDGYDEGYDAGVMHEQHQARERAQAHPGDGWMREEDCISSGFIETNVPPSRALDVDEAALRIVADIFCNDKETPHGGTLDEVRQRVAAILRASPTAEPAEMT